MMRGCGMCQHKAWDLRCERGGGSKPQPAQIIPAPPPPDIQKTAAESTSAQLQNNPALVAQQVELQGKYGPQIAQQEYDLASKYGPMYQALISQLFPQLGQLGQQLSQGLTSPFGLSAAQQSAQDAIRQRAYDASAKGIRESANVGGTLYGGQRQLREDRARNELAQGFATQDIGLQGENRDRLLRELVTYLQSASPNFQQPSAPQFGQASAASGNSLYNALVQNAGNFGVIQGSAGQPGLGGPIAGGLATGGVVTAKLFFHCLPGTTMIDTASGPVPIQEIEAGDELAGSQVIFKSQYAPAATPFVKLWFEDGTSVETCDRHLLDGRLALQHHPGDVVGGKVVRARQDRVSHELTYDLLTNRPDGGYTSSGIPVASMIPLLHKLAHLLQEVA